MGHGGCLKKAMGLSKTDQGVKTVLKNVSKEKNEKTYFTIFPFINFQIPL